MWQTWDKIENVDKLNPKILRAHKRINNFLQKAEHLETFQKNINLKDKKIYNSYCNELIFTQGIFTLPFWMGNDNFYSYFLFDKTQRIYRWDTDFYSYLNVFVQPKLIKGMNENPESCYTPSWIQLKKELTQTVIDHCSVYNNYLLVTRKTKNEIIQTAFYAFTERNIFP